MIAEASLSLPAASSALACWLKRESCCAPGAYQLSFVGSGCWTRGASLGPQDASSPAKTAARSLLLRCRKCESDISTFDLLLCRRSQPDLCGSAEHDVLPAVDFVNGGHAFECGVQLVFPKHLAR